MIALLAMAAASALQPQAILTIDPKHRLIEGVASDGKTIWVSSLFDRQVLACTGQRCTVLATLPKGLHPFALAWDDKRQRLWVAADCPAGIPGVQPCQRGALIGYSKTGQLRTRIATLSGAFHPGDVSAAPAGVFVSDSHSGAVYQFTADGKALETLVPAKPRGSAQGSALDLDGRTLIVADYGAGLAAVDLVDKRRTSLPAEGGEHQQAIDGLVRCGHTYYGVWNSADPGALLAIHREGDEIVVEKPLGELPLADPTQVALAGQRLLIVTKSGWAEVAAKQYQRKVGATILAVDLPGDCAVE